jgi:hypothetical protein
MLEKTRLGRKSKGLARSCLNRADSIKEVPDSVVWN